MKFKEKIQKEKIHKELVDWYYKVKRDLPWRKTKDPYKIWISEVMLQQTQVETVKGYYKRFLDAFPTVFDLAKSDDELLMKMWEGLGYYSRARNLKRAAIIIAQDYNGIMPTTLEKIKKLPGIGPYTAGAVLSIAYDKSVPAVDGNVIRVYSRLFQIEEAVDLTLTKKNIDEIALELVHDSDPSAYNQALMELGATICTPKNPKCLTCPVKSYCKAYQSDMQHELPKKSPKKPKKEVNLYAALIWKGDKILILKRPPEGLLPSLWSLPSVELDSVELEINNTELHAIEKSKNSTPEELCKLMITETTGLEVDYVQYLGQATHVFTHIKWSIQVIAFEWVSGKLPDYPETLWVTKEALGSFALPTAYKKAFKAGGLL